MRRSRLAGNASPLPQERERPHGLGADEEEMSPAVRAAVAESHTARNLQGVAGAETETALTDLQYEVPGNEEENAVTVFVGIQVGRVRVSGMADRHHGEVLTVEEQS